MMGASDCLQTIIDQGQRLPSQRRYVPRAHMKRGLRIEFLNTVEELLTLRKS